MAIGIAITVVALVPTGGIATQMADAAGASRRTLAPM